MEDAETITRMRAGDQEAVESVHKFYCMAERRGGGDGVEGCILKCILYILLPQERIT